MSANPVKVEVHIQNVFDDKRSPVLQIDIHGLTDHQAELLGSILHSALIEMAKNTRVRFPKRCGE